MKPAAFRYTVARSAEEAVALLSCDEDAVALAGGQSLVPMLNFRLARPSLLVDLNPAADLAYLRESEGALRIGALTRQAALERSPLALARWPLLVEAVSEVAHSAVRSRGTVGGSVAQADPKAELPVALTALDARFHLRSRDGARTLSAGELFQGPLTTAIAPGEILAEIEVPAPVPGTRMAFVEQAQTHGDYAIGGAAVVLAPDGPAVVALLGAGPTPCRAAACERALAEGATDEEAATLAGAEATDDHRGAVLATLVARALARARSAGDREG